MPLSPAAQQYLTAVVTGDSVWLANNGSKDLQARIPAVVLAEAALAALDAGYHDTLVRSMEFMRGSHLSTLLDQGRKRERGRPGTPATWIDLGRALMGHAATNRIGPANFLLGLLCDALVRQLNQATAVVDMLNAGALPAVQLAISCVDQPDLLADVLATDKVHSADAVSIMEHAIRIDLKHGPMDADHLRDEGRGLGMLAALHARDRPPGHSLAMLVGTLYRTCYDAQCRPDDAVLPIIPHLTGHEASECLGFRYDFSSEITQALTARRDAEALRQAVANTPCVPTGHKRM